VHQHANPPEPSGNDIHIQFRHGVNTDIPPILKRYKNHRTAGLTHTLLQKPQASKRTFPASQNLNPHPFSPTSTIKLARKTHIYTHPSVSSAVLCVDWLCSLASCVGYFQGIFCGKAEFPKFLKSSVFTKLGYCRACNMECCLQTVLEARYFSTL
jgi:hypothetical protein